MAISAAAGVLGFLAAIGPVNAATAPEVVHLSDTHAIGPVHNDPNPFLPCDTGGTTTGVVRTHFVLVDHGDGVYHVTYHENFTSTTVPDDPSLPILFDRGSETVTFTATRGGTTVFTSTNHDNARSADGEWLRVRGLFHFTIVDLAPFGPSDNDIVRTQFDHFSFTCSYAEGVTG